MEGAPKIPSSEDKKKANETLRKLGTAAGVVVGSAIAAASPMNKALAAESGPHPIELSEKVAVRPQDLDDKALKNEIEANRAVFQINKDGEIRRIADKKE